MESFGVLEQGGAPALPGAVRAAAEFGIDLSAHRARVLEPAALAGVELAVGFEPAHVAGAVAAGVSQDHAFLLTELAQVLELDVLPWPENSDSFEARVSHANARRFAGARLPRAVADPVGGSDRMFRQTYDEIDRMVAIIAMRLFGASVARAG